MAADPAHRERGTGKNDWLSRQLAANRIITGSLGHLAECFILNIKLIEVESGVTLSATYQVYRSLSDLVDNADDLVVDLVGKL